ncbi:putative germin-like protein 2-2 [Euphorbia lathyris]|uniref:putative germin-like protein 2-2 n=1 Tax=Euphorbia lathyris TaxID=212925 RepID=UPI00331342BA
MASKQAVALFGVIALTLYLPFVSPFSDLLQDFCVANTADKVHVDGFTCKDPKAVEANDFFMTGFEKEGDVNNPVGSKVKSASAKQIPGLNTLGLSMVRIDLAPNGVNPPHIHPRGSEMIAVIEGTMDVGFVTSAPEYRLFSKVLNPGDVFVFPMGLVHYQRNTGSGKAIAIGAQSSQNAGVVWMHSAVFNSTPTIPSDMLGKVYQVDSNVIDQVKKKF